MIRRARPDDAGAIRRIAENAYRRYVAKLGRPPAPMVADFERHIATDTVFVVELKGAVVGYAILLLKPDQGALLDNIAVDPGHQGAGIGRALVTHVEQHAAARGHDDLDLYTNVVMTENLRWYRALGFTETRRVTELGFERVYMAKGISAQS